MTIPTWTRVKASATIQRSSHNIAATDKEAYIYGGELVPRQPVDPELQLVRVRLEDGDLKQIDSKNESSPIFPQPRVGSACVALNGKLYIFSGRGGIEMAPIEESGAFWVFDTSAGEWSQLLPASSERPFPAGRSYHALATDHKNTIYLHAGCPEKGRLNDLWAFDTSKRQWTELAPAPGPACGGTSIAYTTNTLFRMNGFDGKTEQGGSLDLYNPAENKWSTILFSPDGVEGPEPRSVACLCAVDVNDRPCLITMFGERDPSNLGHAGAGKMLRDTWMFDIRSQKWEELKSPDDRIPEARGWFDAAEITGSPSSRIVLHGGLAESNERLDDVWVLKL